MKIVFISDWFAEDMGYSENLLPQAMARLGHEVHLVTSDGRPYFTQPMYEKVYAPIYGSSIVDCYVRKVEGVTIHRLPHTIKRGSIWIQGLYRTLKHIGPDIVQVFEVTPLTTLYSGLWSSLIGYRLFSESRMHASVYSDMVTSSNVRFSRKIQLYLSYSIRKNLRSLETQYRLQGSKHFIPALLKLPFELVLGLLEKFILFRIAIGRTEKCYPLSEDVLEILSRVFDWPEDKLEISPLGVNTSLFRPPGPEHQSQRNKLRLSLGFADNDIVCIYTGRFTKEKDPLSLALAIQKLAEEGLPFRGLFVGHGDTTYIDKLSKCSGSVLHPFVAVSSLPSFYWAADIGVWPRQESTSQFDAMACGLPLVLSDQVRAHERTDGNAATFREGDFHSLALTIKSLFPIERRKSMGKIGAERARTKFSWDSIAASRIEDYRQSVLNHLS